MFLMGLLHNNKWYSQQAAISLTCHVLQSNDDDEGVANTTDSSHINRGSLEISSPSGIVRISCFQERDFWILESSVNLGIKEKRRVQTSPVNSANASKCRNLQYIHRPSCNSTVDSHVNGDCKTHFSKWTWHVNATCPSKKGSDNLP